MLRKKTMLENGDLIFCKGPVGYGTGHPSINWNYSHVAIFWMDRSIMQLKEGGVLAQSLKISLKLRKSYDLYRYAQIRCPEVKKTF